MLPCCSDPRTTWISMFTSMVQMLLYSYCCSCCCTAAEAQRACLAVGLSFAARLLVMDSEPVTSPQSLANSVKRQVKRHLFPSRLPGGRCVFYTSRCEASRCACFASCQSQSPCSDPSAVQKCRVGSGNSTPPIGGCSSNASHISTPSCPVMHLCHCREACSCCRL